MKKNILVIVLIGLSSFSCSSDKLPIAKFEEEKNLTSQKVGIDNIYDWYIILEDYIVGYNQSANHFYSVFDKKTYKHIIDLFPKGSATNEYNHIVSWNAAIDGRGIFIEDYYRRRVYLCDINRSVELNDEVIVGDYKMNDQGYTSAFVNDTTMIIREIKDNKNRYSYYDITSRLNKGVVYENIDEKVIDYDNTEYYTKSIYNKEKDILLLIYTYINKLACYDINNKNLIEVATNSALNKNIQLKNNGEKKLLHRSYSFNNDYVFIVNATDDENNTIVDVYSWSCAPVAKLKLDEKIEIIYLDNQFLYASDNSWNLYRYDISSVI